MRWRPCVRHNGAHLDVHGQCVHHGAPYAFRPAVCAETGCGAEIMRRIDLVTGRVDVIEAGSDQPHQHTAPLRVELDPETLAQAIVSASRAARQDATNRVASGPTVSQTNEQQRAVQPRAVVPPPSVASPERDIPTVQVWSDNGVAES